jgi:hypothetical protein
LRFPAWNLPQPWQSRNRPWGTRLKTPRVSPGRQGGDQRSGYVQPPDPPSRAGLKAQALEDCGSVENALQRVFIPLSAVTVKLPVNPFNDLALAVTVQFPLQAPESQSHHVAVMELGPAYGILR